MFTVDFSRTKTCPRLHFELRSVNERFPQPVLVGKTQSFSLPLHQYLLLCQHQARAKRSLKKFRSTEWVVPLVPLCWLCSKYRVSAFLLPLLVTMKEALKFRAKRNRRSIYQSDADAVTNYRLISSLSCNNRPFSLFDVNRCPQSTDHMMPLHGCHRWKDPIKMLKNVCTADQSDHRKSSIFTCRKWWWGKRNRRRLKKSKLRAFISHLFPHFEVCLFFFM